MQASRREGREARQASQPGKPARQAHQPTSPPAHQPADRSPPYDPWWTSYHPPVTVTEPTVTRLDPRGSGRAGPRIPTAKQAGQATLCLGVWGAPRWEEHLKHPDREAANVQVVPEGVCLSMWLWLVLDASKRRGAEFI